LEAEAFDLVAAVSLVDSVPDPYFALGQACALVRPGGHLLFAQPDAWNPVMTSPDRWIAEDRWDALLESFGCRVVARADGIPWRLRRTPRQHFEYTLHARLAQKGRES
jgi:SAM-dependent methyltransferase